MENTKERLFHHFSLKALGQTWVVLGECDDQPGQHLIAGGVELSPTQAVVIQHLLQEPMTKVKAEAIVVAHADIPCIVNKKSTPSPQGRAKILRPAFGARRSGS